MTKEEALNEIRSWAIPSKKGREVLETLIPELAESESEDERIRKKIIENVRLSGGYTDEEIDEMISWLEKQKEQKPAEWSAKGRRGRIGSTPEHIRNKAENFLSKMEPPYDADDICSAYETGAMESIKQEWSEEDKRMLNSIINIVCGIGSQPNGLREKQVNWLKSLRPSWKPSEEQMKALEDAFRKDGSDEYRKTINSLYQQLKRL